MRSFDYSKLQTMQWDTEILGLVAQIHECKGRQELYLKQKAAVLDKLMDIAKVQSTEASNKMEGIAVANARVQQLCQEKITPRNREEQEIMGYRAVLNTIYESYAHIPVCSADLLRLHRELYRYCEEGLGGRFKNTQNGMTALVAVDAICESFNRVVEDCTVDPLVMIPIFINDFLCIRPFEAGNGPMSRLLTTLLLCRCGYLVGQYISLERKIEKNKDAYREACRVSGENWQEAANDPTPFVKYLLGILLSAYREFEERVGLLDEKLPAMELVRRTVSQKTGKFTKSEIMELVPSIGKASVENALKKLLEEGVIQRHGKGKATFYTRQG